MFQEKFITAHFERKFLNKLILLEKISFYPSKFLTFSVIYHKRCYLYNQLCEQPSFTCFRPTPNFLLLNMSGFYFFMIHHYKNSISSLHIFVHHCTFCASQRSLHVKTSPV